MGRRTVLVVSAILCIIFLIFSFTYKPYIKPFVKKISSYTIAGVFFRINQPPVLIMIIPNLTWDEDTVWPNAFDLDNYFYDPEDDPITYNVTGNSTINVLINSQTHTVSFSQPADWFGSEEVFFTADDGNGGVTNSNIVNLTVEDVFDFPKVTGGGGVSPPPPIKDFSITPLYLNTSLRQGETRGLYIRINNTCRLPLKIKLEKDMDLIKFGNKMFDKKEINLTPSETIRQRVDIITFLETEPDLYIGKIIASSGDITKQVPVFIEVQPLEPSFNVEVRIPQRFKEIQSGKSVVAGINITSLEKVGLINIKTVYDIRNSNGESIVSEEEILSIKDKLFFNKKLKIPKNIESGDYIFYVKVNHEDKIGTGSDMFKIIKIEKPMINGTVLLIIIIATLILFLIIIILRLKKIKKLSSRYEKTTPAENF